MPTLTDRTVPTLDTLIETATALQRADALARATRGLTFDPTARRYRRGKRLLTQRQQVIRRDALADRYADRFARLVERYASGDLDRAGFEVSFAALLGEASLVGYAFGRGGLAQMADADWTALGLINAEQELFARRFFADIQAAIEASRAQESAFREIAIPRRKGITDAIINRAKQYADTVVSAYERARAALFGLPLPVHPPVHPNCRCAWSMDVEDGRPVAYWRRAGDACPTCTEIAARYQPWRSGS